MSNNIILLCILVLTALSCCVIAEVKGSLPNGFYDIDFFGTADCASSPSSFRYKPLDACSLDLDTPEFYETTTCSAKAFETQHYCSKGCKHCGGTSSGPIGCLSVSGVYSILRTCGPAPNIMYENTWLLKYKAASGNCSESVLESGNVANSCYPTSFNSGVKYECTPTTRTEITYDKCDIFTCSNCKAESKATESDIGICKDSQTFECVSV